MVSDHSCESRITVGGRLASQSSRPSPLAAATRLRGNRNSAPGIRITCPTLVGGCRGRARFSRWQSRDSGYGAGDEYGQDVLKAMAGPIGQVQQLSWLR